MKNPSSIRVSFSNKLNCSEIADGAIGLCKFESFNRIVRAARRSNLADRVENLSETFSYQ
jgi:SLT domain-containing protein